jgi:hypothetical protein
MQTCPSVMTMREVADTNLERRAALNLEVPVPIRLALRSSKATLCRSAPGLRARWLLGYHVVWDTPSVPNFLQTYR